MTLSNLAVTLSETSVPKLEGVILKRLHYLSYNFSQNFLHRLALCEKQRLFIHSKLQVCTCVVHQTHCTPYDYPIR